MSPPVDVDGLGSELDDEDLDLLDDLDLDPDLLGDLDLLVEAAELADEDLELADDDLELELADDDLELADDDLELAELELELGGLGWLNERGAFMATDSLRGCFWAAGKTFLGFFAIGITTGGAGTAAESWTGPEAGTAAESWTGPEALGRFAGDGLTEGTSSLSELEEAMIGQVTEFENVEKLAKKRPTALKVDTKVTTLLTTHSAPTALLTTHSAPTALQRRKQRRKQRKALTLTLTRKTVKKPAKSKVQIPTLEVLFLIWTCYLSH